MRKILLLICVLTASQLGIGCRTPVDLDAGRRALLDHHEASLQAHRENTPEWFIQDRAEDYVSVNRGEILRPSDEETLEQFRDYLGRTRFTEYRDLALPVVRISSDGTMGWIAVQVKVKGVQTQDDGTETEINAIWAWLSTYEKRGGKWIHTGNASNRKPN